MRSYSRLCDNGGMLFFAEADASSSLLEQIAGQPFIVSLLLVVALLFGAYIILEKLGASPLQRILALIPLMLVLAVFYFQDGPLVATVLLSTGFVLSFAVAFLQLGGKK